MKICEYDSNTKQLSPLNTDGSATSITDVNGVVGENGTQSNAQTMMNYVAGGVKTLVGNDGGKSVRGIASEETTTIKDIFGPSEVSPSTSAYVANEDYLIYDGKLRKVIANIAVGDDLVEGTNIEATTMMKELKSAGGSSGGGSSGVGAGGTVIVQIPTVTVNTYTYNGTDQGPTITGLDTSKVNVINSTATDVGTYTMTLSLKDPLTMVWPDSTNKPRIYTYTIKKAAGNVTLSKSHLIGSDTVVISNATGPITISVNDATIITLSHETMEASGGTLTVSKLDDNEGTTYINITVAETATHLSVTKTILYTSSQIYGVKWPGYSSTNCKRTDASVNIESVAAIGAANGSSPFDAIYPWSGMQIVEDEIAGTLVSIPKYYYKWTKTGTAMTLQISPIVQEGFHVSPAHADRGDGQGERDVVYVGRYHCDSDYKSTSGTEPKTNETRATFRTSIHNLGSEYWQYDFAMYWTICMLYFVEYASWNSQSKIGKGCGKKETGLTDNMNYHTGTYTIKRTDIGHVQYRYIEDLWAGVYDWCDGIYFAGTDCKDVYVINNPANFSDSSGGTMVGTRPTSSSYIKAFTVPSTSGFEWALYPSSVDNSVSSYVCDRCEYYSTGVALAVGSQYTSSSTDQYGMFYMIGSLSASDAVSYVGSRIMKLPNNI